SAKKCTRGGLVSLETETLPAITCNTVLNSRALDGNQWSALNESFFQTTTSALERGEVAIKLNFSPSHDDGTEFVELSNVGAQAVNLRGARFTHGIHYGFAENRDTLLAPRQKLVLVRDLFRFRQRYGLDLPVAGIYSGKLKDAAQITLTDASGKTVATFRVDA